MGTFDNPFIVFVTALVAQWVAAYAGASSERGPTLLGVVF